MEPLHSVAAETNAESIAYVPQRLGRNADVSGRGRILAEVDFPRHARASRPIYVNYTLRNAISCLWTTTYVLLATSFSSPRRVHLALFFFLSLYSFQSFFRLFKEFELKFG